MSNRISYLRYFRICPSNGMERTVIKLLFVMAFAEEVNPFYFQVFLFRTGWIENIFQSVGMPGHVAAPWHGAFHVTRFAQIVTITTQSRVSAGGCQLIDQYLDL